MTSSKGSLLMMSSEGSWVWLCTKEQQGGPFLDTWVMLVGYVLILWLVLPSQATACFLCFANRAQRFRICQYFLGYQSPQHAACLNTLQTAFLPYSKMQVAVFEFEKLKHIFSMVIFYLEEKGTTNVPYHQAIPGAVEEVKKEVEKLKPATTVDKAEGDGTLLKCEVKFALPPETTVKWRFAKDIHTQHLFLFKDLYFGTSSSLLIRPTLGSHHGTYTCQIQEENDVLVRKFFYLNVTTKRLGREKDLQKMFRDILHPPPGLAPEEVVPENKLPQLPTLQEMVSQPNYLRKKNVILLIVGLALSSMLLTMMALSLPTMKEEVDTGVRFIARLVNRQDKLDRAQVERFRECLAAVLCERFHEHWYPENPLKGQAYRCIRINKKHHVDDSLLKACMDCGLDYSQLELPREVSIWIDPGEVCCRLGENSHYFTVHEEESSPGKTTPELETSDYHSESPSESSSEDEGPAKQPTTTSEPSKSRSGGSDPKQAPQYFYMPAPLWVPYPQRVVSYVPAYQPVTVYYIDVASKSPAAKTRNPNLVKRLTKRASRA
ncbi:hypothetical protein lerEdw1_009655 [Lerista edwardsae]|nr:hypothetical protein lerEdw1_009655 [Lerista edwardsae]